MKSARALFVGAVLLASSSLPVLALETEISLSESFLKSTQDVNVTFTLTNTENRPVRVLRWEMPFEGIEANLFEVVRNGEPVTYLGRVYKRGLPQDSDFMLLKPGQSLSAEVELSAFYNMRYTGEYTIRFRGESLEHAGHGLEKARLHGLTSNEVVLWMDGDEPPVFRASALDKAFTEVPAKAKPGSGTGTCSNTQLNKLDSALSAAQGIAADAYAYLSGPQNASSLRYTEWFGEFSSSRWNTVESNFQAISSALDNAPVEFDCSCNQNYFAYVYPSQPYKIYLCRAFWRAATNGTDSKAGTLVHEMSHFNAVAGTDDVTYGQNSCRALADSSPNSAIRNADSHEYFAENSPSLP